MYLTCTSIYSRAEREITFKVYFKSQVRANCRMVKINHAMYHPSKKVKKYLYSRLISKKKNLLGNPEV